MNCTQKTLLMKTIPIIKKVFKELGLKNIGDYHDLYVQLEVYLKTLEISVLKYVNLILLIFLSAPGLAWEACLKKRNIIRIVN